jgi:hypothetical protein
MNGNTARHHPAWGRVTTVTAMAFLAVACSGGRAPHVATLPPTSASAGANPAPTTASTGSSPEGVQAALLAYAKCMRANGEPGFPDPVSGGFEFSAGFDRSSPQFKAAQGKCEKLLPNGGLGPVSGSPPTAQWLAQMVKASECMRRHGVPQFPDPGTSVPSPLPPGTAIVSNIQGAIFVFPDTIDQASPTFTQAAAACGFPLHNH